MSKVVISTAMPLDATVADQSILEVRVLDWTEDVPAVIAHRFMGYNASREFNVGGEFQLYLGLPLAGRGRYAERVGAFVLG